MISVELAERLALAGLRWHPAPGDRFVIPQPELGGQVFTLSEMTIEAHHHPSGTVLGFNGTTEWALDSVAQDDALWLPREDQLRDLLGGTFVSLTVEDQDQDDAAGLTGQEEQRAGDPGRTYVVTTRGPDGHERRFTAPDAADAYAGALLALVQRAVGSGVGG
ncbi:pilus assembly protein CpaE [Actinotalea sp. Marseille-Q4924]|uniref:pilus assembly protein CpaE n=1 Tax=Actinotalea sp. Marseille-Q4924 TaxID=2866571 RepID=UPI001CE3C7B0|nr:pilus assembly protein CpaE [Actinotalea sp. Marseille-Q4924]